MTKYKFLVIVSSFQLFLVDASISFVCMCAKECVKEMQGGAIAAKPERKMIPKMTPNAITQEQAAQKNVIGEKREEQKPPTLKKRQKSKCSE